MVKIFLFILVILGCCVLSEAVSCCMCSNGQTIDVSYRECKDNNTCKWTCSVTKHCGPLFWDPSANEGPPIVTSDYWIFNPHQDDPITMPCNIRSNPEANVTWMFNGKNVSSYPNKVNIMENKGECSSDLEVTAHTNGWFTCLVQNAKGSGNHTFKVEVIPNPVVKANVHELKIDTADHKAYLGTTFNLSCSVIFNRDQSSVPQILFNRNGYRVWDISGRYENFPKARVDSSMYTSMLSLKNVTIAEEGNWSCYGFHLGIKGKSKYIYLKIVPCPAGYYCPWYESTKHECPYGTYSDGSTNITYQCTKCPGQYPSTKPQRYFGPAKSVQECPVKETTPYVNDFSVDTVDHNAYLGTTFNLSCTVIFHPSGSSRKISFVRHGNRVLDVQGKYENFPEVSITNGVGTRKLSLKNVTIAEEGNWSCNGRENGNSGKNKRLTLKIVACPAGYYCPWYESTKHECPYGTYSDGSTNITYQCTKCPAQYPSDKPEGYSGPAKSIQECPAKPSQFPVIIIIVVIVIIFVLTVIMVIKFKKPCKQFLLESIGVNNLASSNELVINDFLQYEQRLLGSAAETPEFPILYDVFISYSSKDVTFATEIQRELESQDFKCCIHIRDFTPGDTILNNISNAIYGSRVTLAILSPDFVESEWCKGELQQALTRSMRDHRVIPILYKNCQIPRELLHRTYIDYENCYVKPYFWEQLIKALNPIKSAWESSV